MKGRSVCIRYGEEDYQYIGIHSSPEEFSDAKRTVIVWPGNEIHLASEFDGPAMELVRAYLIKDKENESN